ncbi:kyphoscoliosis peptidase [Trichonephila clavipes]|uniref:Kyphoscoliosis peptidase n=1 Tax=Trichonephila clavipes TaxID=2585209 RepID=A0A8X6SBG7_TRICX|nr:kyphoscoliosis peptidase [Trichonephila clavipes]
MFLVATVLHYYPCETPKACNGGFESLLVHKEVKISAHEPMRWKYKLYAADEIENASLNNYVFCQLKEDRLVGSFAVTPPVEGRYYFKVSNFSTF